MSVGTDQFILTEMRRSVRRSLETWGPLQDLIETWYGFDDDTEADKLDPVPTPAEMPALALWPATGNNIWDRNQSQTVNYNLRVMVWTETWTVELVERIWEEVVRGVYQSDPDGTGPLGNTRNNTGGFYVQPTGSFASQRVKLDGQTAVQFVQQLTVRTNSFKPQLPRE